MGFVCQASFTSFSYLLQHHSALSWSIFPCGMFKFDITLTHEMFKSQIFKQLIVRGYYAICNDRVMLQCPKWICLLHVWYNNRMEEDSTPLTPILSTQTQLAHDEYLMIQSWRPCWYNLECEGQNWTVVSEARERAYCRRILQRWIFGMLHAERQHTCRAA